MKEIYATSKAQCILSILEKANIRPKSYKSRKRLEARMEEEFGVDWRRDKGLVAMFNYTLSNIDKPLGYVDWEDANAK
ncbi:MAG: hypothetical protein ACRCX7_10180 [Cetobacterium sp.]|uniref:hypothetical protein n=1 Tax=Cetobacterium sp. TaxID=2071632 RepID=UPI003F328C4B